MLAGAGPAAILRGLMHRILELPTWLVSLVLLALAVVWFFGWRKSSVQKERELAPFAGVFALAAIGLPIFTRTLTLPTYGFCMGLGCLALATLTIYWARREGLLSMEHTIEALLITGVCGLIGARGVFLIEAWDTHFADKPPAMAVSLLEAPAQGDSLTLATNTGEPFTVTFSGEEDTLQELQTRLEEAGRTHDLLVELKTTQHRGDEGILTFERGLLLKTGARGSQAVLKVIGGSAARKLGLAPRSYTKGVDVPFATIFNLRMGGLTYFGSVIGVLLSAAIYLRFRKVSYLRMLDLVGPALPLGLFFGRLGCLANGCCWGREAGPNALYTVQFPPWSPAWSQFAREKLSLNFDPELAKQHLTPAMQDALGPLCEATPAVHATQLYEGITVFVIFLLALAFRRFLQARVGQTFAFVVLLQAPVRFVVEHFRRDHEVFFPVAGYPLTESQTVALVMFAIALPAMVYLSKRGRPLSEARAEEAAARAAAEEAAQVEEASAAEASPGAE